MSFGRLIGAATGLEVARGGALEWVEGQMDKQTDRRTDRHQVRWTGKRKKVFQGAKLFFHLERK